MFLKNFGRETKIYFEKSELNFSSFTWSSLCSSKMNLDVMLHMFHFQFLDPLSSFSVGYKSESNDANDSKKEDLSWLFGI